ncbi:MAG: hypothetical protein A2270_01810 [Elusimicrobia bacterium RIFOXYA12_FULL_51_18]|nr:MAG: hypothetical protein A2270_01810 [Elusimicrobia bacterium RIFOXYA12_FULL_51_18]OGS32474.1 MAG: hypothetical protein A2218_03580 [Elusimicrobia bacterium RIFOXYA2_FULL_53_38]
MSNKWAAEGFLCAHFRVYGRGLERIPIIRNGEYRSSRTAVRAGAFRSRRKTPAGLLHKPGPERAENPPSPRLEYRAAEPDY